MSAAAEETRDVYYYDGSERVLLGDYVTSRIVFKRRPGRVVYLPGVSPFNLEFQHDNLTWVGVHTEDGYLVGSLIDPETHRLQKKVRLVRRAQPGDPEVELPDFPQGEEDEQP